MDPVKKKVTNNLHNYELTFGEVVARFDEELPKLRKHVYTAAHQWQACKEAGEHVQIDVVLTIEDYQMNLGKFHLKMLFH